MKRLVLVSAVIPVLVGLAWWGWTLSRPDRPWILFITLDAVHRDHLEVYGYPLPTTPSLARIARRGVVFDNVFAAAAWTPPAMATLLFGGGPPDHGVYDWHTEPRPRAQQRAWPRWLKTRAGYRTAFFTNHPVLDTPGPGMCHYFDTCVILKKPWQPAEVLTRRVLEWARAQDGTGPWLVWVHYFDPHEPFAAPPPWTAQWLHNTVAHRLPAPLCPVEVYFGEGCIPFYVAPGWPADFSVDVIRARYDAELAYTDAALGRLVAGLRRQRRDVWVSITADHGEVLYRPPGPGHPALFFSHGTYLYDDLIRIPWILSVPDLPVPPGRFAGLVAQADIPATLLRLLGVGLPPQWRGYPAVRAGRLRSTRRWTVAWEVRANWAMLVTPDSRIWVAADAVLEVTGAAANPGRSHWALRLVPRVRQTLVRFWQHPTPPRPLPPDVVQELRQLGYLGY